MSLSLIYNNPGNVSLPIKGYGGPGFIVGAPGQSGYASFPSLAAGISAFNQALTNRILGGHDTLANFNYAADKNWASSVSKISGIGINETLNPNNSSQMAALQYGIVQQETGNAAAFGFSKGGASSPAPGFNPGVDPGTSDLAAMGYSGTPADMKQDYAQDTSPAPGLNPGVDQGGSFPSSSDLAAMGYSGTPADMSQDYTQDLSPGSTGGLSPGLDPGIASTMGVDGSGNPLPQNVDAFSGAIPGGGLQQPLQDVGSGLPGPMGQIVSPHAFAGIAGMIPGPAGKIISGVAGSLPSMAGIGGGAQSSGAGLGDSSGGIPVYLTDIAAAGGSGAGPQIQKGLETAGQDISKSEQHASEGLKADTASITAEADKDTKAITTETTGVFQYLGNLVYDVIPRIFAGAGAVVLLGLGIWMIAKDKLVPSVHVGV